MAARRAPVGGGVVKTKEKLGEAVMFRVGKGTTVVYEEGQTWLEVPAMRVLVETADVIEILRFNGLPVEEVIDDYGAVVGWTVRS